jgi:hypothetical protein
MPAPRQYGRGDIGRHEHQAARTSTARTSMEEGRQPLAGPAPGRPRCCSPSSRRRRRPGHGARS